MSFVKLSSLQTGDIFKLFEDAVTEFEVVFPIRNNNMVVSRHGKFQDMDGDIEVIKVRSKSLRYASIKTVFPSEVSVTSHEIAKLITELDSVGQAEMLNELARLCKTYMSTQLQSIADNQLLTGDAKYFMKKVGDYS